MKFSHWIFNYWPMNNFDAITLPGAILFKYSREETDPLTIAHEMVHIEQRKRIGMLRFYVQYLAEYAWNLIKYRNFMRAYYEISFEKEAYSKTSVERV